MKINEKLNRPLTEYIDIPVRYNNVGAGVKPEISFIWP